MSADENRIRLKIDLRSGILELDAPPAEFESAIQKTKELASSLHLGAMSAVAVESPPASVMPPVDPTRSENRQAGTNAKPRDGVRTSGAKASSALRSGRLGSFEPIRDLLTDEQHKEIYAFMQQKAPAEQEDQVLVAVYKGEQLLGRQGFSYNEIYTLLWRAGIDPLPKAIDVVVQRLIRDQRLDKGSAGYFMKFLGQSRVEKELPLTANQAA
jgi:hypothetical protein